MNSAYTPPAEILDAYAHVLINFALGSGKGVRPGQTVLVMLPESAKLLYAPLRNTILQAGAHPIMQLQAEDVREADALLLANDEQLDFFPDKYYRGLIDQVDHSVAIIAQWNKFILKDVDPKRIMQRSAAMRQALLWRNEKEAAGAFTWTLGLYGTPAMAKEVGMSLEEYWEQIISACYLDQPDPVQSWQRTGMEIEQIRQKLNSLAIERVHIEAEDIDLWVRLGKDRTWLGGGGRNIPSFEVFISPDWRGTEGTISFNQPLYRYGNSIEGISLTFKDGLVVQSSAKSNEELLKQMIATENADKIGEFSLTDSRHSRITRTMGETLFDENIGGAQGNTHIALGNAYQDSYPGDASSVTAEQWEEWGYNQSVVHTDIVSTSQRIITAVLQDGREQIIYQNGQFQV